MRKIIPLHRQHKSLTISHCIKLIEAMLSSKSDFMTGHDYLIIEYVANDDSLDEKVTAISAHKEVSAMSTLDAIGKTLNAQGIDLDEMIARGREIRAALIEGK